MKDEQKSKIREEIKISKEELLDTGRIGYEVLVDSLVEITKKYAKEVALEAIGEDSEEDYYRNKDYLNQMKNLQRQKLSKILGEE